MRRGAVIVEREIVGPAVVGGPGGVAALKQKIAAPIIAHNKNNIALELFAYGGELSKVHSAQPVFRDVQRDCWFPLALAHAFLANRRIGLRLSLVGAKA